jgi:hypothetical protein
MAPYLVSTANVLQRLFFYVVTRGLVISFIQIVNAALFLAAPSRLYW